MFEIKEKDRFNFAELAQELYTLAENAYEFGSPWKLEQFQKDLENPNSRYLLLTNGVVIGYIGFWQVLDEVEITNVVIQPEFQGQGLAGLLMKTLAEKVRESAEQIFLEVRVSNFQAQNVYLTLGYEIVSRRKNYYSNPVEDALVMIKRTDGTQLTKFI